jgi:hypothetical protein
LRVMSSRTSKSTVSPKWASPDEMVRLIRILMGVPSSSTKPFAEVKLEEVASACCVDGEEGGGCPGVAAGLCDVLVWLDATRDTARQRDPNNIVLTNRLPMIEV